ncbi:MAG: nucleoside 2-deoxyribosyltransferase [Bacilli bacterium]|jgi:nucleoside 2-deoxyribosyltransferase
MNKIKIYLAGPDVFRKNAIEHLESLKKLASQYGFEGLAPLDNVVIVSDEEIGTPVHSNLIFKANVDLIKKCDIIIANINPFRGACIDDGTAWEIGCGYAWGKMIYGYSDFCNLSLKAITQIMFDVNRQEEYSEIEDFGNTVNLMIVDSIKNSGGSIFKTFEDCLVSFYNKKFSVGDELESVKDGEFILNEDESVVTAKNGRRYVVTSKCSLKKHDLVFDKECANVPKGYHGELGHIESFSKDGFTEIKLIDGYTSISDWYCKPLKIIK